jgi:DUF2934 family protein
MAHKTTGIASTTPMKKSLSSVPPPVLSGKQQNARLDEEIRRRAYEIYLARNGSPGNEHEDWLIAEREIRSRHQQQYRA